MLDGTLKTMLVDDSQPVANLMVVICTKIGITNHDEYSLVRELVDEESETQKPGNFGTLTLKRKKEEKGERDAKMEQLRKKLKTDDEGNEISSFLLIFKLRFKISSIYTERIGKRSAIEEKKEMIIQSY